MKTRLRFSAESTGLNATCIFIERYTDFNLSDIKSFEVSNYERISTQRFEVTDRHPFS